MRLKRIVLGESMMIIINRNAPVIELLYNVVSAINIVRSPYE
jgi:hypothetical protein